MRTMIVAVLCAFVSFSCANSTQYVYGEIGDTSSEALRTAQKHVVYVEKEMTIRSCAEIDGKEECQEETTQWHGSGFVTDVSIDAFDNSKSLVMTAGHVCADPDLTINPIMAIVFNIKKIELMNSKMSIVTFEGKTLDAVILKTSDDPDVCSLAVTGIAGLPVEIADRVPTVGSSVVNAGYPLAVRDNGFAYVNVGKYVGKITTKAGGMLEKNYSVFTTPVAPGLSGSPVLFNDRVVAIVVAGFTRFNTMALCTELDHVAKAHEEALKLWRK